MKNSKNQKQNRGLIALAVILGVVCVSVAFAAMSTTLTINGSLGLGQKVDWYIHFTNLQTAVLTTGAVEERSPIMHSTYIGDFDVQFSRSNSSVRYNFEIANDGDFNAILTTLNHITPLCTSDSASITATQLQTVCSNITYSITTGGVPLTTGYVLPQNTTIPAEYTITYIGPDSDIPVNEKIVVSKIGLTMLFSQN